MFSRPGQSSVQCDGLRILLVGFYPPPYGGIASHLASLIPGLKARGAKDVAVVTFGLKDEVQQIGGATVYRYNTGNQLFRLALPSNWHIVFRVLQVLGPERVELKGIIRESIKAILVNRVAEKHSSEVVSFYQSDFHHGSSLASSNNFHRFY